MRFADRAAAGRALASLVTEVLGDGSEALLLAVVPGGIEVAAPVAAALGVRAVPLTVERSDTGVRATVPAGVADRTVIVVDDGVETGRTAAAVAAALRAAGAADAVLAVPVCPRETAAHLARQYDEIVAVVRPLGRRSLRWHYTDY